MGWIEREYTSQFFVPLIDETVFYSSHHVVNPTFINEFQLIPNIIKNSLELILHVIFVFLVERDLLETGWLLLYPGGAIATVYSAKEHWKGSGLAEEGLISSSYSFSKSACLIVTWSCECVLLLIVMGEVKTTVGGDNDTFAIKYCLSTNDFSGKRTVS